MPRRIVQKVGEYHAPILLLLLAATVVISIFSAIGWSRAKDAQKRLTSVEETQRAEALGKKIADVTTCFNQSKNRPKLIVILQGIAVELEPDPRQALNDLISEYEAGTPSPADCIALARKNGIDPKPYLKNPPSEAGNGEAK